MHRSRPERAQRGSTLVELLLVLILVGLVVGWGAPVASALLRRAALRAAAFDVAGLVRRLRQEAVARSRYEAWQFSRSGGRWSVQRIVDGDGDGVRTSDVRQGIDWLSGDALDLTGRWRPVALALPDHPVPRIPPARGVLQPGSDPLRLSGTDRISCAPNGSCTGGTLYLSAGDEEVAAVVIYGITGRVRLWHYEAAAAKWMRF